MTERQRRMMLLFTEYWSRGWRSYYRDGKLYEFAGKVIRVTRFWGERAGCWLFDGASWKHVHHPELEDVAARAGHDVQHSWPADDYMNNPNRYFAALRDAKAARQALQDVPPELLLRALSVSEGRWRLLQLFNRVPETVQLFDSTPAIAFMLAHMRSFRDAAKPMRAARALVKKKQKTIIRWLGFDGAAATVRVLRRAAPADFAVSGYVSLRQVLDTVPPKIRAALNHLPMSEELVVLAFEGFSPSFLHECAVLHPDDRREVAFTHYVCMGMMEDLGWSREDIRAAEGRIASVDAHYRLYNRLENECERLEAVAYDPETPLPLPVVAPIPGITYIESVKELLDEGRKMDHCAGNMASACVVGATAVCRIEAVGDVSRATARLARHDGRWVLTEIKGYDNAEVDEATRSFVESWLAMAQE